MPAPILPLSMLFQWMVYDFMDVMYAETISLAACGRFKTDEIADSASGPPRYPCRTSRTSKEKLAEDSQSHNPGRGWKCSKGFTGLGRVLGFPGPRREADGLLARRRDRPCFYACNVGAKICNFHA